MEYGFEGQDKEAEIIVEGIFSVSGSNKFDVRKMETTAWLERNRYGAFLCDLQKEEFVKD